MSSKLQIVNQNSFFKDQSQPGALVGATLVASGIKNSIIVFHGYLGCNIEIIHMRSDTIPGGHYTPIIATGLNESDSIYGATDKLKDTLKQISKRKYSYIWIITGDATSITADDIYGVASQVNLHPETKVVPLDVPGFLGGIARGTDVTTAKILNTLPDSEKKNDSFILLAPHLMGIKSHPYDIDEITSLLNASEIEVSAVISKGLSEEGIQQVNQSRYVLPLTYEDMPEVLSYCNKSDIEYINSDLPLPIGIANTEEWLLGISKIAGKEQQARNVLLQKKEIVERQLKYNYNFSWMSTLFCEKTCSIYANASMAVSLARCFFYDLNIKTRVIAVLAETDAAIEKAKRMLEPLAEYQDIKLMFNPDYYSYVNEIKQANVDFAAGSIQDKPLCVGEDIPHMSISGYYFFNNFNFIPWPYMGIRGMLAILTELGFQMEKTFYYEDYWKNYSFDKCKPPAS